MWQRRCSTLLSRGWQLHQRLRQQPWRRRRVGAPHGKPRSHRDNCRSGRAAPRESSVLLRLHPRSLAPSSQTVCRAVSQATRHCISSFTLDPARDRLKCFIALGTAHLEAALSAFNAGRLITYTRRLGVCVQRFCQSLGDMAALLKAGIGLKQLGLHFLDHTAEDGCAGL